MKVTILTTNFGRAIEDFQRQCLHNFILTREFFDLSICTAYPALPLPNKSRSEVMAPKKLPTLKVHSLIVISIFCYKISYRNVTPPEILELSFNGETVVVNTRY